MPINYQSNQFTIPISSIFEYFSYPSLLFRGGSCILEKFFLREGGFMKMSLKALNL